MGRSLACLLAVLGALAIAGCGDGSSDGPGVDGEQLVDWPLFGRVPERTHYLPTERQALDPPLREKWSINTMG
ncbi:MAG: hypothetical protein WD827_05135 [Solirubrobacterales bacterium]